MNPLPTDRLIVISHLSGDSKFKDFLQIHGGKIFNGIKSKLLRRLFQALRDQTSICLFKSKSHNTSSLFFLNCRPQSTTFCFPNCKHFDQSHASNHSAMSFPQLSKNKSYPSFKLMSFPHEVQYIYNNTTLNSSVVLIILYPIV